MSLEIRWIPERIPSEPDLVTGARFSQLTSQPVVSHNIYCEQRYTSRDGNRIAFLRAPFDAPQQLWVCDLGTGMVLKVGDSFEGIPTSNLFQDTVYFIRLVTGGRQRLTCLNLVSLEMEDVFEFGDCPAPRISSISPDGKIFVAGIPIRDEVYGLYRIDLPTGKWEVFHEHKDILNPHVQIEPSEGEDILVQWNRGGKKDAHGNIIRLVGEEGASLYVIDLDGGNLRYLPVGKPHTAGVTGHECWIGDSKRILLTTGDSADAGRLFTVSAGDEKANLVCKGYAFNHISASVDGRFFIGDCGTQLYIGSFKTGHVRYICDTRGQTGRPQYSHPHSYMTPGNKFVIFNSNETGIAQVCTVEIPEGFLESLESVSCSSTGTPGI